LIVDSNFLCDYFDNQAGLLARLSKILANVSIDALAPPSSANSTMIAFVFAFPASELLSSHRSLIASTQIVLPRQQ
jgi:hypothetical protein